MCAKSAVAEVESHTPTETAIQITRVRVGIKGIPPGLLFQSKGGMEAAEGKTGKSGVHLSPMEDAVMHGHWMGEGKKKQLCIPAVMLYRSICQAAGDFKWQKRKTMGAILGSTISIEESRIPLGTAEFTLFHEYVRIPPRTGPSVKVGRPLLPEWQVEFTVLADCEMWRAEDLQQIIQHAGKVVGIGAWRPALRGPYGRFVVQRFEIQA